MTYTAIVSEIVRLPLRERLSLIEALTRSVVEEMAASAKRKPGSSLDRMLGILKSDGPMATDEELKEDYINYLVRKYV